MVEDIYGEAKAIDEDGGGDGIWWEIHVVVHIAAKCETDVSQLGM